MGDVFFTKCLPSQTEDKLVLYALERNNNAKIELHFSVEARLLLYKE